MLIDSAFPEREGEGFPAGGDAEGVALRVEGIGVEVGSGIDEFAVALGESAWCLDVKFGGIVGARVEDVDFCSGGVGYEVAVCFG